ncbi:hypothetical protein HDU93_001124, partial [Gonapodya sp. JEL0774]
MFLCVAILSDVIPQRKSVHGIVCYDHAEVLSHLHSALMGILAGLDAMQTSMHKTVRKTLDFSRMCGNSVDCPLDDRAAFERGFRDPNERSRGLKLCKGYHKT